MATLKRWREAQEYEKGFWERSAGSIENGTMSQLSWYQWKAQQLDRRLTGFVSDAKKPTGRVLEIGSGPIGIVNFLEWGERMAIDPLERFYRDRAALTELRRPEVKYLEGTGESLPFPDAHFTLVIFDNAIDHAREPATILKEIRRVLVADGVLYLAVNVHTRWGAAVHDVLAALYIDKGHPYSYTTRSIRDLLGAGGFVVRAEKIDDYRQARATNVNAASIRDRLKGYAGISEFEYSAVCSKEPG